MQRIVIVANTLTSVIQFRLSLLRTLRERGFEVHVIAPIDCERSKVDELVQLHPFELDRCGMNLLTEWRTLLRLYRLLKTLQPDTLLLYTIKPIIYGGLCARWLTIPMIAMVTGLGSAWQAGGVKRYTVSRLYRVALAKAKRVIFLNQHNRDVFVDAHIIDSQCARIIHGEGVDTEQFTHTPPPESSTLRFLFIGRLLRDKGIVEYCEVASRLRKDFGERVRCQILGPFDTDNPSAIAPEVFERACADGHVEYLGVTTSVVPFLQACDCIVLPSYGEGLSMALLEASAVGRPIITTRAPGGPDMVEEGENGLLCEARSAESLYSSMKQFADLDAPVRIAMSNNARVRAQQRYDERVIHEQIIEMVTE